MSSINDIILKAIKNNNLIDLLELKISGVNVNFCMNGKTPLMYALESNTCKEIVIHLIKSDADVNAQDVSDTTPLMYAMQRNTCTEIITTLINFGANVNAYDKWKRTPLMYTTCNRCKKNICYNKENVQALLKSGANAKHVDSGGNTILHLEICSYLINLFDGNGISLESKDKGGDMPLMTHVLRADSLKVQTLLSLGANPNCKDVDLNSPICNTSDEGIINMLLYYGANLNTRNIEDKGPLIVLFERRWTKSVLAILKHMLLNEDNEIEPFINKELVLLDHKIQSKIKECTLEISKMKILYIAENLTFYDFCLLKKTKFNKFVNISKTQYLYNNNEIKDLFPNYYSIIMMKLKFNQIAKHKNDMLKKLEKVNIMPLSFKEDIPGLNYDSLYCIGKLLSNKQLYNLLLASI